MTAVRNLTNRKSPYAFAATAVSILLSLGLAQTKDRTRFVYLISEQPAAGLQVTVVTPDGKRSNYTTDASGYVAAWRERGS